jgi:DNA-binding Lrp family transcriptional regulator
MSSALLDPISAAGPTPDPAGVLSLGDANRLATALQSGVPLVRRPFHALADTLALEPGAVMEQIAAWRHANLLREISAVLEGAALGYDSALVAGSVPLDRLDEVADVISAMPTVTHNYLREHELNLWFTIAVPQEWGLETALEALTRQTAVPFHPMRRTLTFKVGVNFDLESRRSRTEAIELTAPVPVALTERERRLFRALQHDLPAEAEPFHALAAQHGFDADELLDFAREHLGGAIRRVVGTFRHRRLGVRGNGMAVWNVSESALAEVGPRLAEHPDVSHCYARESAPGFPYTLYSMIHGPDRETCIETASRLEEVVGTRDYRILFSTVEYKKCRLRYFLPELDAWWSQHVGTFQ